MMQMMRDWDAFVTPFVARCKGRMIYELWNEADANHFSGLVTDMVTITSHERRIDPTAIILALSGGSAHLDRFFTAWVGATFDVVSYRE
jgi:hypothetical protein